MSDLEEPPDHVDIAIRRRDHIKSEPAAPIEFSLTIAMARWRTKKAPGAKRLRWYRIRCRTNASVKYAFDRVHQLMRELDGTVLIEKSEQADD